MSSFFAQEEHTGVEAEPAFRPTPFQIAEVIARGDLKKALFVLHRAFTKGISGRDGEVIREHTAISMILYRCIFLKMQKDRAEARLEPLYLAERRLKGEETIQGREAGLPPRLIFEILAVELSGKAI